MRTCELDGCENSLEGMQHNTKYCCVKHRERERRQKPEHKSWKKDYYNKTRKPSPRKYFTCQLDGCKESLEGMLPHAKYCCKKHKEKATYNYRQRSRRLFTCQLDGCEENLEGRHLNTKYCCRDHWYKATYKPSPRKYFTCQLDGCENSLDGVHGSRKYCCKKHVRKAYRKPTPRKYFTCQLEGCKNSLEEMLHNAKYCCVKHGGKAYNQKPEVKAAQKAHRQIPEVKARKKAYKQTPEQKAAKRVRKQKRRALKASLPATFTAKDWIQTCKNFGGDENGCYCAYCAKWTDTPWQEHFVALSKKGPYTTGNILPACPRCQNSKHAKNPEDFLNPKRYKKLKEYLERKDQALQLTFFQTRST